MNKIIDDLKRKNLLVYILFFSGVVVTIILVMGVYLYRFYYKTIYDDFKNVNETYLSGICSRHENDMAIMDDIVTQMSLSGSNVEFKLYDAPTKSLALKEQLYRYLSVSRFYSQVFFLYHEDQYLYNHSTSVSVDMFLAEGIILGGTPKEELHNLLYNSEKGMKVLKEQKISGYIAKTFNNIAADAVTYLKVLEPKNKSTMIFIVGDFYYDELFVSDSGELRMDFILFDNQMIVSRGDIPIESEALLQSAEAADSEQFQAEFNGGKYLVTVKQGESGLLYGTVQAMSVFYNKIWTGQWGILFVLLICSIPASLAIVTLSLRLSRKVRAINVLLNEDDEHYYDLENIESGIRTLVEQNREAGKENLSLRRTRFINNFVRNDFENREKTIAAGARAGLNVDLDYYTIVLMGDHGNSNENKAYERMLTEIGSREDMDGFGIHLLIKNQSLFVLFGNDTGELEKVLEVFFRIGMEYCEDFIMSSGAYHQDFAQASEVYLEADTAFDNRLLVDNSRIIHFTEIAGSRKVELLPETYLQRLKNAIRGNDDAEVKKVIREICRQLQTSGHSLLTFRILCNDIIHMLWREWNMNHTGFENIYNVFSLSQCLTIQDFNDILWEACQKLLDGKAGDSAHTSDMVAKAIEYMKNNYNSQDLNMSSLAEYLGISTVTLAVEFKNKMGISPSDYLAIVRIENAKVLLRETQLLVKEVSAAVGYEDDHVFTRRFKRYVGKTPGQYRVEEQ